MFRPAALFLAAALFCQAPAPAFAQVLKSAPGEWVVGPINIKSSSGRAFCSMKTRYADGRSLVVASDSNKAHSLAIDFGKKSLSAGTQYYITLYIGPVTRTMVAIAATTEVLIAQMGDDPDFFAMMRAKDRMDADFNGGQITFPLKGSAAAMDELAKCVTALGAGTVYEQAKVPSPEQAAAKQAEQQAVAAEIARNDDLRLGEQALSSSLADEVKRLREENRRLQLENQAVAARLRTSDLAAAEAELATLAELERRERALKIENDRLRAEAENIAALQQVLAPPPPATPSIHSPTPSIHTPTTAAGAVSVRFPDPAPVQNLQPAAGAATSAAAVITPAVSSAPPVAAAPSAPAAITAQVLAWQGRGGWAPEQAGDVAVWRWQEGNSLVAVQAWPAGQVEVYLDILQSRCTAGDFARQLAAPVTAEGVTVVTAEIACLGEEQQMAAGLVFVTVDADMAVVTYETDAAFAAEALKQRQAFLTAVYSGN